MTYENVGLNEITEKINELETLLNEAKQNLSDSVILEKFSFSFKSLESALKSEITKANEKSKESLENQINLDITNNTKTLFDEAKDEILAELKANVDLDILSNKVSKEFLKENEKNLENALKTELTKQNFNEIIKEYKQELNNSLNESLEQGAEAFKSLENELNEINLNYKKIVDKKSTSVLKEYINEHKASLFKPFSLNFIKKDIIEDKDFKNEVKEVTKQSVNEYVINRGVKDELSEVLLNINKDISDDFFNSVYMREQRYLHNIILASMSLINELKLINLNMNALSGLLNGDAFEKQNIYKVV